MQTRYKVMHLLIVATLGLHANSSVAGIAEVENNLSKLRMPPGFKVEIYAEVPGARQMALGTNGNICRYAWKQGLCCC
jgi:hypothetical protein